MVVSTAWRRASGAIRSRIRILILISLGRSLVVTYNERNSENSFCSICTSKNLDLRLLLPVHENDVHGLDLNLLPDILNHIRLVL